MADEKKPTALGTRSIGEVLLAEGAFVDAAHGTSMRPLIREGLDTIVIAPCSAADLAPMDVVLYERPRAGAGTEYVLHRVVSRKGSSVLALGDACTWVEEVPAAQARGVLVGLYRTDGRTNVLGTARYRAYLALWCRPWRARIVLLRACRRLRGHARVGMRGRGAPV